MATTSVHLPEDLVAELDRLADALGVSRNRLIVEACRARVRAGGARWPTGFLQGAHLSEADRALLERSAGEFEAELLAARHSRGEAPF